MQAIRYLDAQAPDDAAWDSFVAGSPEGHLLQTSNWGRLKSRYGWEVEPVVVTNGDAIIAGVRVLYRSLPLGLTLAYVPKGPLVDWDDEGAVVTLLAALREGAHRRHAFCLKLEPDLLEDPGFRPCPRYRTGNDAVDREVPSCRPCEHWARQRDFNTRIAGANSAVDGQKG